MNIYLFGEFCSGYTQYPSNDSCKVLERLHALSKADTQIVIHRDDNLMYYAYIRKISENRYCGICITEAGHYYSMLSSLFPVFEKCIEQMAYKGNIIHFDSSGELTTDTGELYTRHEDVILSISSIKSSLQDIVEKAEPLPSADYSIDKDSVNYCNVNDNMDDIISSSYIFGYTVILKEEDYNTVQFNDYRAVLSRVNTENAWLKRINKEIKDENTKKCHQEEYNSFGIVMAVIFFIISIGALVCNRFTQRKLDDAKVTIAERDNIISDRNETIAQQDAQLNDILQKCYNPCVVTSCSNTKYSFRFDYDAIEERNVTVTLKAINENSSEVLTNTHDVTFVKGGGSMSLYFSDPLNGSDYYYIVLICNGKVLAGRRW